MADLKLTTFVRGLPLFRELPADLVDAVAALGRVRELAAGESVFRAGERSTGLFAVAEGSVKIFHLAPDGLERIVHRVGPGRTFAEAVLFHGGTYPASAAALESPTRLVHLDGPALLELFASEPRLAASMLGSLSGWLHTLMDHIETLTIASAGARLAHHLLRLPAREQDGVLTVTLPMAKKDLASELSITPETLSRLLARWRERGLVAVEGRRVALRDVAGLETLAESGRADGGRAG